MIEAKGMCLMDDVYLDMIEAAFPYITSSMKRPVAAFLKIQELQKTMSEFNDDDMVSACNLDSSKIDMEQMLKAMRARATPEIARQIDTILNTRKMLKVYQNYQDVMKNMSALSNLPENSNSSSSNDMLNVLLNDLIQKNNRGE